MSKKDQPKELKDFSVKELVEGVNNKFVRPTKRDRYVFELQSRGLDIDGKKLKEVKKDDTGEEEVEVNLD